MLAGLDPRRPRLLAGRHHRDGSRRARQIFRSRRK
jgi:hypothetical protein